MRSNKNRAVIGVGIAGLRISFQLKDQGHNFALFEQADECKSVGAGFILQPSGQNFKKKLNLLSDIEAKSHRLNNNESYEAILAGCKKKWVKNYYGEGHEILTELKKIK